MAARAALHSLLQTDLTEEGVLYELGFRAVYAADSVDSPEEQMFFIIRWEEHTPSFDRFGPHRATVWAHSKDPDFGPIDKALEHVKDLVLGAVHLQGEDGWTLTVAEWRGDSTDLVDDGFHTIARNSGYDVVSRTTPPEEE
jgi:hypothetical protein